MSQNELIEEFKRLHGELVSKGYFSTSTFLMGKEGTPYEGFDLLAYVIGLTGKDRRIDIDKPTYLKILNDYMLKYGRGLAIYIVEDAEAGKKALVLVYGGRRLLNQIVGFWFEQLITEVKRGNLKPVVVEKVGGKVVEEKL